MSKRRLKNAARRILDWLQGSNSVKVDPMVHKELLKGYRRSRGLAEWVGYGDDNAAIGWPDYLKRVVRG